MQDPSIFSHPPANDCPEGKLYQVQRDLLSKRKQKLGLRTSGDEQNDEKKIALRRLLVQGGVSLMELV
jgi:hypothetical protein